MPELIARLDDERPTKITIEHGSGFGGMLFDDEYDYNRQTTKQPPIDVNREFGQTPLYFAARLGMACQSRGSIARPWRGRERTGCRRQQANPPSLGGLLCSVSNGGIALSHHADRDAKSWDGKTPLGLRSRKPRRGNHSIAE